MKFYAFLAVLTVVILETSCESNSKGKSFQTHFWTSSNWGEDVYIMVDDTIKGKLPYLDGSPQCGDENLATTTLSLDLNSGQHEIVVQNKDGKVVFFEELLTLKNSVDNVTISSSTDYHDVASKTAHKGDCLIEEIFRKISSAK